MQTMATTTIQTKTAVRTHISDERPASAAWGGLQPAGVSRPFAVIVSSGMGDPPRRMGEQFRGRYEREAGLAASIEEIRLLQQTPFFDSPPHHAVVFGTIAADGR